MTAQMEVKFRDGLKTEIKEVVVLAVERASRVL